MNEIAANPARRPPNRIPAPGSQPGVSTANLVGVPVLLGILGGLCGTIYSGLGAEAISPEWAAMIVPEFATPTNDPKFIPVGSEVAVLVAGGALGSLGVAIGLAGYGFALRGYALALFAGIAGAILIAYGWHVHAVEPDHVAAGWRHFLPPLLICESVAVASFAGLTIVAASRNVVGGAASPVPQCSHPVL